MITNNIHLTRAKNTHYPLRPEEVLGADEFVDNLGCLGGGDSERAARVHDDGAVAGAGVGVDAVVRHSAEGLLLIYA